MQQCEQKKFVLVWDLPKELRFNDIIWSCQQPKKASAVVTCGRFLSSHTSYLEMQTF